MQEQSVYQMWYTVNVTRTTNSPQYAGTIQRLLVCSLSPARCSASWTCPCFGPFFSSTLWRCWSSRSNSACSTWSSTAIYLLWIRASPNSVSKSLAAITARFVSYFQLHGLTETDVIYCRCRDKYTMQLRLLLLLCTITQCSYGNNTSTIMITALAAINGTANSIRVSVKKNNDTAICILTKKLQVLSLYYLSQCSNTDPAVCSETSEKRITPPWSSLYSDSGASGPVLRADDCSTCSICPCPIWPFAGL